MDVNILLDNILYSLFLILFIGAIFHILYSIGWFQQNLLIYKIGKSTRINYKIRTYDIAVNKIKKYKLFSYSTAYQKDNILLARKKFNLFHDNSLLKLRVLMKINENCEIFIYYDNLTYKIFYVLITFIYYFIFFTSYKFEIFSLKFIIIISVFFVISILFFNLKINKWIKNQIDDYNKLLYSIIFNSS